jgi:hypothetical protein
MPSNHARRLLISGSFTVIDRQQRCLHDRAHTLGFPDLHWTAAPHSSPWLPEDYMQNFREAA